MDREFIEIYNKISNEMYDEKNSIYEKKYYIEKEIDSTWLYYYKLAKAYYYHYNNLDIRISFKTKNGYEYYEQGICLGRWVNYQRKLCSENKKNAINEYQIKLLEEIGFVVYGCDDIWLNHYELAKNYYNHYGNLNVPSHFRTINGYEYNQLGIDLGRWISNQRMAYKGKGHLKITKEQIRLLEKIEMVLDVQYNNWLKNYNLAKSYYQHNGNLQIPENFKTINGYEYDEKGIKLGIWIKNQRKAYKGQGTCKITDNQIKLLEEIKMVWFSNSSDQKLQSEIINERNKTKKQIEILNRLRSYLNTLDENKAYSKEEINLGVVKKLNK